MECISQAVVKISEAKVNRHMGEWRRQHRMGLDRGRRLVIGGLVVSEFGYLLADYSNGELSSFEDFQAIADAADFLNPREYQNLNIGLSTAQANLKDLMMIIRTIAQYVQECHEQGCEERIALGPQFNGK